jgi:hypothetical protein
MRLVLLAVALLMDLPVAGGDSAQYTTKLGSAMSKGTLMGVWMNGSYLCVKLGNSNKSITLEAYNELGKLEQQIDLKIPDGETLATAPRRFARGTDGTWAVSGVVFSKDSRSADFLAILSSDGNHQVVVRTSPYLATAVTVADDGAIWTAGSEKPDGLKTPLGYDIIRRFDKGGKFLSSAIARASITSRSDPANIGQLLTSKGRVGWFSRTAGLYIEFSLDGSETARFPITLPDDERPGFPRVATAALCSGGGLWISYTADGKQWAIEGVAVGREGLKKIVMDQPSYMYGCDDKLGLGFQMYGTQSIHWVSPPK